MSPRLLPTLLFLLPCVACASGLMPVPPPPDPAPEGAIALRSDVFVERLAPGVWRHVSYRYFPGAIASNGLIVRGSGHVLVVDTAWNPEQTALILDWVEAEVGAVDGLVVTHAHDDRIGGLAEFARRGIPTYALEQTARLAADGGRPRIDYVEASPFSLEAFGLEGELFHPGAGHTIDNATVWLAESRTLVGGCLVRALDAVSMGNTAEADLEHWPATIAVLEQRYPQARLVLPGHGEPGGPELLAHTRELLGD